MFDRDNPAAVSIDLDDPARNTVRLGGSHLILPVSGEPAGLWQVR